MERGLVAETGRGSRHRKLKNRGREENAAGRTGLAEGSGSAREAPHGQCFVHVDQRPQAAIFISEPFLLPRTLPHSAPAPSSLGLASPAEEFNIRATSLN